MKNSIIKLIDKEDKIVTVFINHIVSLKWNSSKNETEIKLSNGEIVFSDMKVEKLLEIIQ